MKIVSLLIMRKKSKLLNRRILVLDRHLIELSENLSNNTKDWKELRIKHKKEVQLVGLSLFPNWYEQYQDISHLVDYHKERCNALKLRQIREIAILDELLKVESLN